MPLLRKQPFYREKPPPDVKPEEEVFYCKLTHEIFRDYEKFFERIILCNSLVWSCSITGRSGLTYQEAEESEEKALKQLASFPTYLQKPILYLASKTQRSRIADLNDDVFGFAKDRFFIGEILDVTTGQSKKSCKVVRVVPPGGSTPSSPLVNGGADKSAEKKKANNTKPEKYQYIVQEQGKTTTSTVKFKMLSRKKGLYTREKSKLFLKQNCDNVDGIWRVKDSKRNKLKIDQLTFEDFFAGQPPVFEFSEIKLKKPPKKIEPKESSPAPAKKQKEKGDKDPDQLTLEEIRALREKERLAKEKEKEEKLAQKLKEKEELRRKFEEERDRKKREKAEEMEKKREERRIQAELWREWRQPRDDMDCDDLRVLPEPTPVKCRIPVDYFGDAVMVVEFVNCFNAIFDLKASFPKGFGLGTLEEALLETDAGGLMADLLLMMITAIFSLQDEEDEEQAQLSKQEKEKASEPFPSVSDMTLNQMIDAASKMSNLPILVHGLSLTKLPLDNFTLTEILRLHIMASGSQGNQANAKFRYQQRGGYMPIDDAGLDFKMKESDIVGKLAVENIYDFTPGEKLKVLKLLVDQFLTYAAVRDTLEDNYDKMRQMRIDLKQFQWSEQRREREEAASRYRAKLDEKQKERDIMEKKRLLKLKQREDQVKKEEAERTGMEFQESQFYDGNGEMVSEEKLIKQIEELEASLPSAEDREEQQKQEDDDEADKKAEYMRKERDFMENIRDLQHGSAIYPIGRDRLYRRYWMFKSVPGVFVEDDDDLVSHIALRPISQNPEGSTFDLLDPFLIPPKIKTVSNSIQKPEIKQGENKDGSDKENESVNENNSTSAEINSSSLTTSLPGNIGTAETNVTDTTNVNRIDDKKTAGEDMIVISDDENSFEKPFVLVETDAVKQIQNRTRCKWAFYQTADEIDCLIDALNGRGHRESALKSILLEQKNKINETVMDVQTDLLHIPDDTDTKEDFSSAKVKTREWRRGRRNVTGTVKNDSAHEGLELNLRELIMDLEERIHVGSLGHIKVSDRGTWRDAIENGSYEPCTDDLTFAEEKPKVKSLPENSEEKETNLNDEDNTTVTISKDMAKALVQIERGIDAKYLQPPLGDEKSRMARLKADMQRKGKKTEKEEDNETEEVEVSGKAAQKTILEKWEDSCLLSTSLAQVFLHLSTLEKSVTWSKSLLHTRCRICRRKCDPEKLLLCDGCDRGHHIYCLKPPLKHIPKEDWYCQDCRPKESKRSPRKERRRNFSEQMSDEEENMETEEQNGEEEEAEDEASEEEDLDSMCAVCSKTGTLVCCDNCPLMYHLACADPPLKKVPRGKWICQICTGTDTKVGKIKMNLGKNKSKGKANKTSPSSSRQASRRGSPRDSPLTIKPARNKRKREGSPVVEESASKLKRNARSSSKLSMDSKTDKEDVKHYTSSSRGNTKVIQLKLLEDLVMSIMEEEDAWPFLRPVSKKDAPDYYDVIKKPMDFQTIKNKIKKFDYGDPAEIVQDVRLIFSNCIEYNKRTTQEFKAGASMSKIFERKLKNLSESSVSNGPPTKKSRTK